MKKVLIVGGGFGGVRVAIDLAKAKLPNTKIVLVSDKPHFEYHASLYRVVTGRSPLEVCIPLAEIFKGKHSNNVILSVAKDLMRFFGLRPQNDKGEGKDVEVVEDTIVEVDLKKKRLAGSSGSHYAYDFLVLALGSETSYFDLPGFREFAFGFKSIADALRLKRHLHEIFSSCVMSSDKEKECALKFVIVGGGATGTELSGELAVYTKQLANRHRLDPRLITIDLIQGRERLLPSLPPAISEKAKKRLELLGVAVLLNKRVMREDIETVYLKDMQMKTKTVIWTAGVVPHHLYKEIKGLSFDEEGGVIIDNYLQPIASSRPTPPTGGGVEAFGPEAQARRGSHSTEFDSRDSSTPLRSARNDNVKNVFVIGDAAATPYSGMAQTALHQGGFVADVIAQKILGVKPFRVNLQGEPFRVNLFTLTSHRNEQGEPFRVNLQGEPLKYRLRKPFYAIPIGPNWAIFISDTVKLFGILGWWMRRLVDFQFFLSILPLPKAITAFRSDAVLWEQCRICSEGENL